MGVLTSPSTMDRHLLLAQAITRDAITTIIWGLLGGLARCESETELMTLNPKHALTIPNTS